MNLRQDLRFRMRALHALVITAMLLFARSFRVSNPHAKTLFRRSRRPLVNLQAANAQRALSTKQDTIYALSSGMGQAGVSVVRVSGPQAKFCLESLLGDKQVRSYERECSSTVSMY